MDSYVNNDTAFYVVLALVALWQLPIWGRRILEFLRELREFRSGD